MGPSPSARLNRRDYSTPIPGDQGLPHVPPDPAKAYQFTATHTDRLRRHRVEAVRVRLAALLFIPALWPDANVERAVTAWLPNVPAVVGPLARAGQRVHTFLATVGKGSSLSFVALAGMLLALAAWVVMRRPKTATVAG